MNQIGGAFFDEGDLENMMDMAGIADKEVGNKVAKAFEDKGINISDIPQLNSVIEGNPRASDAPADKILLKKGEDFFKLINETVKVYKLNIITKTNTSIQINVDDNDNINQVELEKIINTTSNTPYITVTTYYRVKALEGQLQRLSSGFISVITYLKLVARMIDNIRDGCGGIGNNCLFLEEGILFFNKLTNFLIKNNYNPVGPVTMGNEMMKQSYFNSTLVDTEKEQPQPDASVTLAKYSDTSAATSAATSAFAAGKRRKSSKKKKGSKKKRNAGN